MVPQEASPDLREADRPGGAVPSDANRSPGPADAHAASAPEPVSPAPVATFPPPPPPPPRRSNWDVGAGHGGPAQASDAAALASTPAPATSELAEPVAKKARLESGAISEVGEVQFASREVAHRARHLLDGTLITSKSTLASAHICVAFDLVSDCTLLVHNMPAGIDSQELRDHFAAAGSVVSASVQNSGSVASGAVGGEAGRGPAALAGAAARAEFSTGGDVRDSAAETTAPGAAAGTAASGAEALAELSVAPETMGQAALAMVANGSVLAGLAVSIGAVQYQTPGVAQTAMQMLDGSDLRGSRLSVQLDMSSVTGCKLTVSNLPRGCTDDELRQHCTVAGEVPFASIHLAAAAGGPTLQIPGQAQPPGQQALGNGKLCRYFNTQYGCRYGANCIFLHDPNAPALQVSTAPDHTVPTGAGTRIGAAFYKSVAAAQAALQLLDGSEFGGSKLQVQFDPSSMDGCKLLISNIPPGVSGRDLANHCAVAGEVPFASIQQHAQVQLQMQKQMQVQMQMPAVPQVPVRPATFNGLKLCRYYTSTAGCRYGPTCRFTHSDQGPYEAEGQLSTQPVPLVGLVQYSSTALAQAALQGLQGSELRGCQLVVQWDNSAPAADRVLVSNLPFACTDAELKYHCSLNGEVPLVVVKQVTAAAAQAPAPAAVQQQAAGHGIPAPAQLAAIGPGGGSVFGMVLFQSMEWAQAAAQMLRGSSLRGCTLEVQGDASDPTGCKLLVFNLPSGCDWKELKGHFAAVGDVRAAVIYPASYGAS